MKNLIRVDILRPKLILKVFYLRRPLKVSVQNDDYRFILLQIGLVNKYEGRFKPCFGPGYFLLQLSNCMMETCMLGFAGARVHEHW